MSGVCKMIIYWKDLEGNLMENEGKGKGYNRKLKLK